MREVRDVRLLSKRPLAAVEGSGERDGCYTGNTGCDTG